MLFHENLHVGEETLCSFTATLMRGGTLTVSEAPAAKDKGKGGGPVEEPEEEVEGLKTRRIKVQLFDNDVLIASGEGLGQAVIAHVQLYPQPQMVEGQEFSVMEHEGEHN